MLIFLRASGVFLKALVPMHSSGVCFPLHFAVFVLSHASEHAFSLLLACIAAFVFPGGSAESSCTRLSIKNYKLFKMFLILI